MTMTTPEAKPVPSGEQPALDVLREQLHEQGDYAEAETSRDVVALFKEQLNTTKRFIEDDEAEAVSVDEAVDALFSVGRPAVRLIVEDRYKRDVDETNLNDDEKQEKLQEIYDSFRNMVVEQVTPEEEARGEAIVNWVTERALSLKDRISFTYKKTRGAYKHYALLKKQVEEAAPGSDERKAFVREKREAKDELKARVAKSFGVTALVAGGVEAVFVSKGIDASTVVTGIAAGAVAPAAAVAYEQRSMKDKTNTVSLRAQLGLMSWVGKAGEKLSSAKSSMSEKVLNMRELDEKDSDAYKDIMDRQELINKQKSLLAHMEEDESVTDDEYEAVRQELEEQKAQYRERLAELKEQYGTEKLTRRAKIGLAIGAVAAVGGAVYLAKYGLPFTGGKGGNSVAEHTPPTGSKTGGSPADNMPPVTAAPSGRSGDVLGQVGDVVVPKKAPSGVSQEAYNKLSLVEKANFLDTYGDFTQSQKEAFNIFADGVQTIEAAHPDATQAQIDTLVTNTLEFAAMKEEYVSQGDNWLERVRLMQEFNEQARRFFEATESL